MNEGDSTRSRRRRAELLLAADFGRQAPGRPIHGRLGSEDNGAGDPRESAGDLARIDGVTPRTRPRSASSSPRPETIANPSAAPTSSPPRTAL